MKASNPYWKQKLLPNLPKELDDEINAFETDIELRRQAKQEEKLFAETRLRRGVYGQRYDNGQRHDGLEKRQLGYPSADLTKGPNTLWHAPGMQRIKIPYGGLNLEQCEVLSDLAEEYSDGIAHVTTRQDFQLHFIHIEDTPSLMRRLAKVGITTREACGNSVRNVTACPRAGCCQTELFDVTPYAKAMTWFLLGHHDVQDFGRKFKITFSGCEGEACGLANMHDLGLIAKKKTINGKEKRGFSFYVGGGLGAVPHPAKLLEEFVPEEEILPLAQAVCRVFSRLGEKKNRARARVKFLVAKLGIEEFRRLVQEERKSQPPDPRWTAYLEDMEAYHREGPLVAKEGGQAYNAETKETPEIQKIKKDAGFLSWRKANVYEQSQKDYAIVTVKLPLGDITASQLRNLASISMKYINGTIRTTVEQNIILRWVPIKALPALYTDLRELDLAEVGGGEISDIVACPGTDTCKLGISASRGLAAELRRSFQSKELVCDDDLIRKLHIKISGCFNSCAQHHAADLGFYGVSRKVGGHTVPHFQVVLGGQWEQNAGSYGLPILAVPSKNIPEVVRRLTERYKKECQNEEVFVDFVKRLGKAEAKKMLIDLSQVPAYEKDASYYSDWSDPREYSIGDMGIGECAGEVVSRVDMDLAAAERRVFDAQLLLDEEDFNKAGNLAFEAMLDAARGLIKTSYLDISSDPETITTEFRKRFYDTKLFFDPYAGGKFAAYLFAAMERQKKAEVFDEQNAHQRVEEASLFIEASHSCSLRMASSSPAPPLLSRKDAK